MSGGLYGPAKCPERQCLLPSAWPAKDREVWDAACMPVSILADTGGEISHLAPISRDKTAKGWGRFLSHLYWHEPTAIAEPAATRVTSARVRHYVRRLQELGNASATILCRLQELGDALSVLAPDGDWRFLKRMSAFIRANHRPARPKHNRVLADEAAELGYRLMREAQQTNPVDAAVQYRDGLILLLLIHLPLRRKNFTNLTIGQSLVRRDGHWFVTLTPIETKTHAYFEAELPPNVVPWLEAYLSCHRPLLATRNGRWHKEAGERLWLSAHGSPLTQIALYDRVTKQSLKQLGVAINPHQFRDIAASTIASHAPEYVHAAAPLLGHSSLRTTEKYYRIAKAQEGHKTYIKTIERKRRGPNG
jgi:integrase